MHFSLAVAHTFLWVLVVCLLLWCWDFFFFCSRSACLPDFILLYNQGIALADGFAVFLSYNFFTLGKKIQSCLHINGL